MSDSQYFLDRSLGFLLGDSSRLLRKQFDQLARSFDITRELWRFIAVLRRDEGINQTAKADIMDIEPITLGRHIDRLEEAGSFERRPDPDDRCVWRIFLTNNIQPALVEMEKIAIDVRNDAMVDFSSNERERFIDNLIGVKSNLAGTIRRDAGEVANMLEKARAAGGRCDG